MDRDHRAQVLEGVHRWARTHSGLKDIDREYSLFEIAIMTRAGPAVTLGLKNKGHLGVGADADVTIYQKSGDPKEMFSRPRYVIKGGDVVAENGRIVIDKPGKTLFIAPGHDGHIETTIREEFENLYTITFKNYPVHFDHYLPNREEVPCSVS